MGPKERLLRTYEAQLEGAKLKAAHDLEARLSGNTHTITQNGIAFIKDEEGHTTRMEAHYSTEELLRLLDSGLDIREAMSALGGVIALG
jgi:hypothetical protein